ncbi:MAG: hypothetical protein ACJ8CS_06430 [Microvirga sp.]
MPQRAGSGFLVVLAIVILSGPALAQNAAAERSQRKAVSRSWADEVRTAIGSGKPARSARPPERGRGSDAETGSTTLFAPARPERR